MRTAAGQGTSAHAGAHRLRTHARQGDYRSTLARVGLAAKGMLYTALGILAINVATGDAASQSVSKRGAIELVASQPFGQWLLGLLTAGLFALAIWRFILAVKGDPVEGSEGKDRAKFAAKGVIYAGTAITALSLLLSHLGSSAGGAASGGGGATEQQAAATIMGWPGGPWLVGLLGLAVIGFGLYQIVQHGMHKKFMTRLDRTEMRSEVSTAVERAGRGGYIARAIVFVIVGTFLIVAAVQHDPQEAVGLSGALGMLAGETWGQAVLWVVAVGLFLYGCFCFAEAKFRRAT